MAKLFAPRVACIFLWLSSAGLAASKNVVTSSTSTIQGAPSCTVFGTPVVAGDMSCYVTEATATQATMLGIARAVLSDNTDPILPFGVLFVLDLLEADIILQNARNGRVHNMNASILLPAAECFVFSGSTFNSCFARAARLARHASRIDSVSGKIRRQAAQMLLRYRIAARDVDPFEPSPAASVVSVAVAEQAHSILNVIPQLNRIAIEDGCQRTLGHAFDESDQWLLCYQLQLSAVKSRALSGVSAIFALDVIPPAAIEGVLRILDIILAEFQLQLRILPSAMTSVLEGAPECNFGTHFTSCHARYAEFVEDKVEVAFLIAIPNSNVYGYPRFLREGVSGGFLLYRYKRALFTALAN